MHRRLLLACTLLAPCWPLSAVHAQALTVQGVRFAPEAEINGNKLVLNGAGARHKLIFPMYALALYLPRKTTNLSEAQSLDQPKRVVLRPLRDISTNELGRLFTKAIQANATKEDFVKLVPELSRVGQLMALYAKVTPSDTLVLDWSPSAGLAITFRGKLQGTPFTEPALVRTLFKIWLGDHPVDAKLKTLLLGQGAAAPALPSNEVPAELL